eukprot:g57476.t1
MAKKILTTLLRWREDKKVQFVVLTSSTDRAFSAGADVRALVTAPNASLAEEFFRVEYTNCHVLAGYPKPVLGLLRGIVMGGGAGLVMHGRFRVVFPHSTRFAMPETGIGLFPDVGFSTLAHNMPGHLGRFLGLTGLSLNAEDCLRAGIGTHALELAALPSLVDALTTWPVPFQLDTSRHLEMLLASFPAYEAVARPTAPPLQPISASFAWSSSRVGQMGWIDSAFGHRSLAEIQHALAAGTAGASSGWAEWAGHTSKLLKTRSPTSCEIFLALLDKTKDLVMPMPEVTQLDYRIAVRLSMTKTDFYEGVRALLIDKDKSPKWRPCPSPQEVDAYLAPFSPAEGAAALLDLTEIQMQRVEAEVLSQAPPENEKKKKSS